MNIIFMRHGEAVDNVKKIISDKEIYWSTLTKEGKETVLESIKDLPEKIDKIYTSPLPRTLETTHFVFEEYKDTEVIIENRLHEIYYGKYSGQENNEDLDNTRLKQIDGDYFIRFGEYGENKYEIENRLCDFLNEVYSNNFQNNTILIVSHGSITSYMKRILNIKSPHIKTGEIEEFINVDFSPLFKYREILNNIKVTKISERINLIKPLQISDNLKNSLLNLVKKEFNSLEFSDNFFTNFISGLKTKKLIQKEHANFDDGIILICFFRNFENFAKKWINHYIDIGIKNFILIDNNSTDNSTKILETYKNKVNISFWTISEKYNCYKMCGWKQRLLDFYGNNKYLIVDSDELLIYEGYKNIKLNEFLKNNKISYIKSLMLDVYPKKSIFQSSIKDFNFVDKDTYKITTNVPYKQRFYGGPRSRIFGTSPSLQKISFIEYSGKEIYANSHYYYPWNINEKAKFCTYLLHYKFLNDAENNYKSSDNNILMQNNEITLYDEKISISINDIEFNFKN